MNLIRNGFLLALVGLSVGGSGTAHSQALGADPERSFALARGHVAIDAFQAERRLDTAFVGSAVASPVDKLIALLDASEVPLQRARYKISFFQRPLPLPNGANETVSFVQVQRFNLGPAVRRSLVASLGAAQVAPAKEFGLGPHISLRATLSFLRSADPGFREIGRSVISEQAAAREPCFEVSCVSLESALERQDWAAGQWARPPAIQPKPKLHTVTTADAVRWLLAGAGLIESATGRWAEPETPEGLKPGEPSLSFVIERDLGQNHGLSAALRDGPLMDDEIRERWFKLETGVETTETSTATLKWR